MTYEAIAFAPGTVLTSLQMNQLAENITLTRTFDWATPVSSPSPGQFRWNRAVDPHIFELNQGSKWVPMLFYSPSVDEGGLATKAGIDWGTYVATDRSEKRTDFAGPVWTPRNMLLNGAFSYWQRGNSFQTGPGKTYTADRWMTEIFGSGRLGIRQSNVVHPEAATKTSMQIQVSFPDVGISSNDIYSIVQPIEGLTLTRARLGTGFARPTFLGFWFWGGVTGRFSVFMQNALRDAGYVTWFDYATASAWQYVQIQFAKTNNVGDWIDTNHTAAYLGIVLAGGSLFRQATPNRWMGKIPDMRTVSGQLNGMTASGTIFRLSEVQYELGYMPTPYEVLPHALDLPMIQRYFWKTFPLEQAPRTAIGNFDGCIGTVNDHDGRCFANIRLTMRKPPTIRFYSPLRDSTRWWNFDDNREGPVASLWVAGEESMFIVSQATVSNATDSHLIHVTAESELF